MPRRSRKRAGAAKSAIKHTKVSCRLVQTSVKPANNQHQTASSNDNDTTEDDVAAELSLLEFLPTEIFVEIARRAGPGGVLALKLSSRSLYNKTKRGDGFEATDIKTWRVAMRKGPGMEAVQAGTMLTLDECNEMWREWIKVMKSSEDYYLGGRIARLTCDGCGERKERGLPYGFHDREFRRKKSNRRCIFCILNNPGVSVSERYRVVHNRKTFECDICLKVEYWKTERTGGSSWWNSFGYVDWSSLQDLCRCCEAVCLEYGNTIFSPRDFLIRRREGRKTLGCRIK
jgi:hypothetical protein